MELDLNAINRLLNAIGGEFEDFQELLDDFKSTAPDLVAAMKAALLAGDINKIKIATHTLKSNARDFGASTLTELSGEAERRCREGETEGLAALVEQIEQQTQEAFDALDKLKAADLGIKDN